MAKDLIGYEALADRALRSVVKEALKRTEKQGLIGQHHFYLTFKTRDPGAELPEFLLERYPEEMTIVLHNQLWGLKVSEDQFEAGLTFHTIPATLFSRVAALTAFVDPSVQFGLQFRNSSAAKKAPTPREVAKGKSEPKPPLAVAKGAPPKKLPTTPNATTEEPVERPGGERPAPVTPTAPQVVSIDKFWKK